VFKATLLYHLTLGLRVMKKRRTKSETLIRRVRWRGSRAASSSTRHSYLTQVFLKSFCRSQLPHKSVNLSFTITNIKNKLTDLCWN